MSVNSCVFNDGSTGEMLSAQAKTASYLCMGLAGGVLSGKRSPTCSKKDPGQMSLRLFVGDRSTFRCRKGCNESSQGYADGHIDQ